MGLVTRYSERVCEEKMSTERIRRFQPWELMHYHLMMGLFGLDVERVIVLEDCRGPIRMLLAFEIFLLRRAGAFQPGKEGRFGARR
jgi:hypothetical protein